MQNDRFVFKVDRAGRHWIWDSERQENAACAQPSREAAIIAALTLLSNAYTRALAERNAAVDIADKIRDIVCPDED